MRIGIVVLCRYSSSRLYGKILKEIKGKKVLEYICDKVSRVKGIDGFCIATSVEKDDDAIERFCKKNNVNIFRGDLNNVSKRFYECAEANNYDVIVRINGDNIFLDKDLISDAILKFKENNLDFLSNVKERTYPKGMSIEIVRKDVYEAHLINMTSDYYREHVMPYFYDNEKLFKTMYLYNEDDSCKGIDLALDTQEDFNTVTKILSLTTKLHYKYNYKEIVSLYKKINDKQI